MQQIPLVPRWLGFAGLLPQAACVLAAWLGPPEWRWTALAMGWAYAALIFSFLGGLWWGLAAASPDGGRRAPTWLWLASIAPSLLALASYYPWVVGGPWPGPSLLVLGIAIILAPLVDLRLVSIRPVWWMTLRVPLSLGLGGLTVLLALV